MKKLLTGLFRTARKRAMTTDNDMGMFRDKLYELVEQKDNLSDEDISAKVEELKEYSKDLPGDEDKEKLERFLEDFKSVKEQDKSTAKEAAGMVADLFEKLDTAAMQDVPAETEKVEEKEEVKETDGKETTEEVVKETEAKDCGETKDDDGDNAEYTLEEIYQFIKKRMAEDSNAEVEKENAPRFGATIESAANVDDKGDDVVTDHAPFIPVTMNKKESSGSLSAMFASIKKGER